MGRYAVLAVVVAAFIVVGFWWSGGDESGGSSETGEPQPSGAAMVQVIVPDTFSDNARIGQVAFEAKCAVCHGANAAGQDGVAPPLVHKIYEPSHHGDAAFLLAVKNGVRAHHWRFGNMPPVEGVTDGDVKMIVAYVRELQRANGIN